MESQKDDRGNEKETRRYKGFKRRPRPGEAQYVTR